MGMALDDFVQDWMAHCDETASPVSVFQSLGPADKTYVIKRLTEEAEAQRWEAVVALRQIWHSHAVDDAAAGEIASKLTSFLQSDDIQVRYSAVRSFESRYSDAGEFKIALRSTMK